MEDSNQRAIKRLGRLRWVLIGTAVVLAITIILLLIIDFGPS